MADADRIVAAARRWLGTPYCHRASRCGAGADCLGLVRGIWRELYGPEPQIVPPYTEDWADLAGETALLDGLAATMVPIAPGDLRRGDILVFRVLYDGPAKHAGILTEAGAEGRFVHAYSRIGVVESDYSSPWQRRLAAIFRFPEESA